MKIFIFFLACSPLLLASCSSESHVKAPEPVVAEVGVSELPVTADMSLDQSEFYARMDALTDKKLMDFDCDSFSGFAEKSRCNSVVEEKKESIFFQTLPRDAEKVCKSLFSSEEEIVDCRVKMAFTTVSSMLDFAHHPEKFESMKFCRQDISEAYLAKCLEIQKSLRESYEVYKKLKLLREYTGMHID